MTTPAPARPHGAPPQETRPQEPLPEAVAARAAADGLGRPTLYTWARKERTANVVVMWLTLVVSVACFVLPGLLYLWQMRNSTVFNRKLRSRRLYLFEHGLVVADADGPIHAARWDAMTVLQRIVNKQVVNTTVQTLFTYTVLLGDGSSFKLTEMYEAPDTWGPAIQKAITRTYLPQVMAAIENGRPVVFADITLSAAGLANVKRGELPWAQIQEIKVNNGVVTVRREGRRAPLTGTPVAQIPNFFVFLAAAETLLSRARQGAGAAA
jgi:hypothetical protein